MEALPVNAKFRCLLCNKQFRDSFNFTKHQNRVNPCRIQELDPVKAKDPNKCDYCDTKFVQKSGLTRHLKTCKVRNDGLRILIEKGKLDEMARELATYRETIAETVTREKERKQAQLAGQTKTPASVSGYIVTNGINGTIRNYRAINYQIIDNEQTFNALVQRERLLTPVAIIALIFCNRMLPENFSAAFMEESSVNIMRFDDGKWGTEDFDKVTYPKLRNTFYMMAAKYCKKYQIKVNEQNFDDALENQRINPDQADIERKKFRDTLLINRAFFRPGPVGTNYITLLNPPDDENTT